MSSEMLPFILPAVFTIGAKLDIHELELYAQLLTSHDLNGKHVHTIIKGIVEGETRVLAASMTMKEIFEGTKVFKTEVRRWNLLACQTAAAPSVLQPGPFTPPT